SATRDRRRARRTAACSTTGLPRPPQQCKAVASACEGTRASLRFAAFCFPPGSLRAMALSSMTGFARSQGTSGPYGWAWELKSVNAKGFDLRLRMPPGWDAIDPPVRARAVEALARGTVYGNLTVERQGLASTVKINEPVLNAVLNAIEQLKRRMQSAPPSIEGILSLKGVIEVSEEEESADDRMAADAAVVNGFAVALGDLLKA